MVIEKGQASDQKELFQLYTDTRTMLESMGVYQWTDSYPTPAIIKNDLESGAFFLLRERGKIIGAISISEEQEKEYQTIDWQFDGSKVMVIHRLVIHPQHQGKGYAQILMDYAENLALEQKYTSIRLDTYSKNDRSVAFYLKRHYVIRGEVRFPGREFPFLCLEKHVPKT